MFDFADFMHVARDCSIKHGGEAYDRSAISRAYYAAYHYALALGETKGEHFAKVGSAHQSVRIAISALNESLGDDLSDLWELRRRADYDKRYGSGLEDDVQSAIDLANTLMREFLRMMPR